MSPLLLLAAASTVAMSPVPNPPAHRAGAPYRPLDPLARVAQTNAGARIEPEGGGAGAAEVYPYRDGGLYQVYVTPGAVSDIVLQPGETLAASGPVAAGDTVRWVIGNTESGSGSAKRVHILVKPTARDLKTNLIVNTTKRTYHLELWSTASVYMPVISWTYPPEPVEAPPAPPAAPPVPPPIEQMNFNYRIKGDHPAWRPTRVYDDGRQTVIEFAPSVAQTEMPPVFVAGPDGKPTSLVNYRVSGQRMVIDQVFDRAELKLGTSPQQKVDIERVRRP